MIQTNSVKIQKMINLLMTKTCTMEVYQINSVLKVLVPKPLELEKTSHAAAVVNVKIRLSFVY